MQNSRSSRLLLFVLAWTTLPGAALARDRPNYDALAEAPAKTAAVARAERPQAGDKDREGRPGEHADAVDTGDPDLPRFHRRVDKERYLREREAYVMKRRGLPYPPDRPNARSQAIRQMEAQELKRYGRRAQAQFLPDQRHPLLNSTSWTSVGPAPIPNLSILGVAMAVSGRAVAIAVHPTNANVLYVGTAGGGLYRSLNGGGAWTPLMDAALSLAIGAIAIDPLNPSTLVVGTGDGDDGFFGVGLYKITSADGTSPVISGPYTLDSSVPAVDVFTNTAITKVLISPTDDNIIFVSTTHGRSGRNGESSAASPPARGLFRSTNFMSASPTFTKLPITTANGGNRRVTDMVFEPNNPNNLIVNVGGYTNVAGVADGGFYRVTSALGASPAYTQTLNIDGLLRAKFAINKIGSTVTVLAATQETAPSCAASAGGVLRRSVDGGQTWSAPLPAASGFCGTQCFFDIGVAVDPSNANNILLGGQGSYNPPGACVSSTQLRSIDGGLVFNRADVNLHPDVHAIAFAPSDPTIVYSANDGGIFKSLDGGATWTSLNNSSINATQFNSFASHPLERFFGIGGTQDNGTAMVNLDGSWTSADNGDGGFTVIDRNANDRNQLLMYHTYFNQTSAYIGFARVTNLGDVNSNGWGNFFGYGGINNGIGNDPKVLFYAPMASGPGNPSSLYFGTDRLYRSKNGGLRMTVVSQAPIVAGLAITSIAISPEDDNVRLVSLDDGSVFLTTNGSTTMADISGGLPVMFAESVAIDPRNKNVGYVSYAGYGFSAGRHVWKNANLSGGGANWFPTGNGIPDVPVSALVIDPRNSNNLYAGTDIGVYSSTDAGNTWTPFGTGLPRTPVFWLDIQDQSRVLRAATHGRGIWEIAIAGTQTPALSVGTISTVPISGNGNAFLEPGENGSFTVQVTNHGVVSATGVSATISTTTAGVTILSPTSSLPDIAAGASVTNPTALTFNVASTVPCGAPLDFLITVAATGASPTVQPFRMVLGGPGPSSSTFTYAGAAVPIPDNDVNGVLVPLPVSGLASPISKVTLTIGGTACNSTPGSTTVGIDHTWAGNLQLWLVSPSGTTVPLALHSGGSGVNLCGVVFDDGATASFASVSNTQSPFTGSYRPAAPLSTFAGENGNGTWQLRVVDALPFNTGNVRAFSLAISQAQCALVLTAPLNLMATALTTTSAVVSWTAVSGSDHYDVYRSSNNLAFAVVGSPATAPFSDSGLSAGVTYLYKVKAVAPTTTSDFSGIDLATTMSFTDDPVIASITTIKGTHLLELRSAVNAVRISAGLGVASFTNSLAPGTPIRATDLTELRTALLAARSALGLATVFTDAPLVPGSTMAKAIHLQEIRQAVK